jgi:flagellar FliL protein
MSEEAKPAPAEDAAAGEGATPAASPKDAPIWMLALVVVLTLAAGGALGTLLVAPRLIQAKQAAAAQQQEPKHGKKDRKKDRKGGKDGEGKPTSYKIENVVVNPADSQGQRFLMCSLAIEADDPKALDTLRDHEVEVRDRVVSLLTSLTLEQLTASGARDSLRLQLARSIQPVLGEDGLDVELKVYLPNFVIQ